MKWPEYKLSRLTEKFISGGTPNTKVEGYWNGNIPWITGADFTDGEIILGRRHINQEAIKNSATNIVPKGSIVMVTRTGVGKISIAQKDIAVSQDITGIVLKKDVDTNYVIAAIKNKMALLLSAQRGATIKGITRRDIANLGLPLPPPSEQRRIVEILDQADRLLKLRAEADKKAERILPALFIKMFGDPATNPMGWDNNDTFGDVGTLDRGKSRHRPRNAPELLGGDHPLIQTGDVANSGGRIRNHTQTYSDIGLAQSKMWPKGTLCITIAANIAKTGVLEFDACFPDSVVGFHPGPDVTTEYVQSWLYFLQPVLENNAPQAAQKNINLQVLRSLPLPKPPLPLQEKFSSMVVEYYKQIDNQLHQGERLETLFNSILHRAFTGDLTASWRHAHMEELVQEMELQAKALAA